MSDLLQPVILIEAVSVLEDMCQSKKVNHLTTAVKKTAEPGDTPGSETMDGQTRIQYMYMYMYTCTCTCCTSHDIAYLSGLYAQAMTLAPPPADSSVNASPSLLTE